MKDEKKVNKIFIVTPRSQAKSGYAPMLQKNIKVFGSEGSDWKQVSKTRKEFYNTDKNVQLGWYQEKNANKLKC